MIDRVSAAAVAAAAHLALSGLLVVWTVVLAGRIARRRDVPPALLLLSGLGGLLVAPAVFVEAMTGSVITGRALYAVAWLWPTTCLVILIQAVVAAARGFVPAVLGAAFIVYNVLITGIALVRFALLLGGAPIEPLVTLSAAEAGAMQIAASAIATGRPFFLFPPVLAPAVPARTRGVNLLAQGAATVLLLGWSVLLLLAIPPASHAVHSFRRFSRERMQERPAADLAIGARLFPTIHGLGPPDLAVTRDVGLARELELGALSVHIAPGAATDAALDSVAGSIEEPRRAGALLIAVLAASDERSPARPRDDVWRAARLREIEVIVRRLRPEYVVPAAPDDIAPERVPVGDWIAYLDAAARVAHRTRPRTRVMIPLSGFTTRDSLLHAWASRNDAPVEAIGFRITPSVRGGAGLDSRLLAVERWIGPASDRRVEHWLLEVSAWPVIFGERNQERALWGTLAWASRQPTVRGIVVHAAGDYGAPVGLRAVSGRVRPAGHRLARAVRGLNEAADRTPPEPPIR
jgi:hypothetical protein